MKQLRVVKNIFGENVIQYHISLNTYDKCIMKADGPFCPFYFFQQFLVQLTPVLYVTSVICEIFMNISMLQFLSHRV